MPTATRSRTRKQTTSRSRSKRRITPEDLRAFQIVSDPRISPDGQRIVFVHKQAHETRPGEYATNLWITDVDGGRSRSFTSGGRDSQPRWSPTGDRLVFVSGRDKPRQQLYVIDAAGGEARPLTRLPEGSIGAVKWSPDGTRLAVSFREQASTWREEATKARKEAGESDPPRVLDHWWYRLDGDGYFNAQRFISSTSSTRTTGAHRGVSTRKRHARASSPTTSPPTGKRDRRRDESSPKRAGLHGVERRSPEDRTSASGRVTPAPEPAEPARRSPPSRGRPNGTHGSPIAGRRR